MGKVTISMAMFNSYVKLPEGIEEANIWWSHQQNLSNKDGFDRFQ